MTQSDEYAPSLFREIHDQVALYEATDGHQGGTLEGKPVIILIHRGAKTGKVHKTPLMRIPYRDGYIAVASYGGHDAHPAWYYNLLTHPLVMVRDGMQISTLHAREVAGAEKTGLWPVANAAWPHFAEYRAKTNRDIPIFVLQTP